ncbi:MAG: deoxynucleoside kinase [Saprospiraceae bacterium]|nr:deoxynucleoside kinase [Saprospiraceae bacterium]
MEYNLPYRYICIEGNIGSGKTTLCTRMAKLLNTKLILEQFTDNPFLPYFYNEPERYAFPVEIFFMTERHKQMQKHILAHDLFAEHIIADYFFTKTLLFAKQNLNESEFRIFHQLFELLNKPFPNPDLLVYLHRSTDRLLEIIDERGRAMETPISKDYLQSIQDAYFDYFRSEDAFPVLIIDVEHMDFAKKKEDLHELMQLMSRKYQPGVHRISIH